MSTILDGKVMVITVGSSGIGLASAEMCVAHGARVVIGDIQDERGRRTAGRLGASAYYVHADVAHDDHVEALVECGPDPLRAPRRDVQRRQRRR